MGIESLVVPAALAGFIVAVLILTPEAIRGVAPALANRLQRSVSTFLGSVLATIGLTVPAVLAIGLVTAKKITLGLDFRDLTMLLVTLPVSVVAVSAPRPNLLQGKVDLMLFLA